MLSMRAAILAGTLAMSAYSANAESPENPGAPEPGSYAAKAIAGARLADQRCNVCHMIAVRGENTAAPSFAIIVAGRSPDQVRQFLAGSDHGGEGSGALSTTEIEDVIAFMTSWGVPWSSARGSSQLP